MEGNQLNEVTFVISRNIKPGYEEDYDDWLRRYLEIERKAPGYLGTTIIMKNRPTKDNAVGVWLTILHCQLLYFFLAAFTGFFAFALTFLTIPSIKYILSLYKFTEVD
jgi:hypothetical protein